MAIFSVDSKSLGHQERVGSGNEMEVMSVGFMFLRLALNLLCIGGLVKIGDMV